MSFTVKHNADGTLTIGCDAVAGNLVAPSLPGSTHVAPVDGRSPVGYGATSGGHIALFYPNSRASITVSIDRHVNAKTDSLSRLELTNRIWRLIKDAHRFNRLSINERPTILTIELPPNQSIDLDALRKDLAAMGAHITLVIRSTVTMQIGSNGAGLGDGSAPPN